MEVIISNEPTHEGSLQKFPKLNDGKENPMNFTDEAESFRYYRPIDKIWGSVKKRETDESNFAGTSKPLKKQYKERFYLKHLANPKVIVDLKKIFKGSGILESDNVLKICLTIFKKEDLRLNDDNFMEFNYTYLLEVGLLVADINSFSNAQNLIITENFVELYTNNNIESSTGNAFKKPIQDFETLDAVYPNISKVYPTFLIEKELVTYNELYINDSKDAVYENRLIFRIGKKVFSTGHESYHLYMHGDSEVNDPSGIPTS